LRPPSDQPAISITALWQAHRPHNEVFSVTFS
jgi:hypothetical protein